MPPWGRRSGLHRHGTQGAYSRSLFPRCGLLSLTLFGFFAFDISSSTNQALDLPGLPLRLRKRGLRALCHICGRRALLPRSLQISVNYNRLDIPHCGGGYADVWMGDFQGRRVAAKVPRVYSTSDFDQLRRVGCLYIISNTRADYDSCRGSARR